MILYLLEMVSMLVSPLGSFKEDFRKACREAEIDNFRFHDSRHTCINNWR